MHTTKDSIQNTRLYDLRYYVTFGSRDPQVRLEGKLAARIKELLYECFDACGWNIIDVNVTSSEVQLTMALDPDTSVDRGVNTFKLGSAAFIRNEFPSLSVFASSDNFWSDEYTVQSINGGVNRVLLAQEFEEESEQTDNQSAFNKEAYHKVCPNIHCPLHDQEMSKSFAALYAMADVLDDENVDIDELDDETLERGLLSLMMDDNDEAEERDERPARNRKELIHKKR